MPTKPKLIYFDLGNVLLHFDHERAVQQMAELSGTSVDAVRQCVFQEGPGLQWKYERGEISSREFFDAYCQALNVQVVFDALLRAGSDIFTVNSSMIPIVRQMRAIGYRLGLLSNTCPAHWEFVTDGRFRVLPGYFDAIALSFQLKAMKPTSECYHAAAKLAGVEPSEIVFIDDREDNVAGAIEAGFRAVRYSSTPQLLHDLRANGVELGM